MDSFRQVIVAMDDDERNSLREEKTRTDFSASLSETTIVSASLLALVLTALVGWYLTSSLTRQIGSAAALLQSSSGELQAAANLQSSGSTGQATAVNEIATTINELLSTSRLIAENAQRVAKVAQETSLTASRGDETVQRTTQSIAGIKTQVDVVVVHVLELGKKSQLIGSITEMINELAEQTNILAINATIEAAGAGEWGKRFAVVADEIRKLADRVSVSSSEIRQLLDNIRASASSTIAATQDGSKLVDAGVREFAEAAVLFRQIAALVSTASEAAREIELSTEQQASAVDQVRVGASDLVQTAHETDTSSKQVLKTSSELAGLSKELVDDGPFQRPSSRQRPRLTLIQSQKRSSHGRASARAASARLARRRPAPAGWYWRAVSPACSTRRRRRRCRVREFCPANRRLRIDRTPRPSGRCPPDGSSAGNSP